MRPEEAQQTLILTLDWLGLSLRLLSDPKPIEGFKWCEYSATNVWAKRRVLWTDEGDRVLTLLSEPRSSVISSNAALMEVENEWLYHGGGVDRVMSTLLQSCYYEVLGISRLDLAVDFVPNGLQTDVIQGLSEGRFYVSGKRNGSGFWSTNTAVYDDVTSVIDGVKVVEKVLRDPQPLAARWLGRPIPHCQSWGHKTSAIKWKLYYKSKELWDAGGGRFMMKPYIADQWRIYGLDISDVWRLEVSVKHCNDYTIYGRPLDLEAVRRHPDEIFCSLLNSRWQVCRNEGHKDRTNDERIGFFSGLDGVRFLGRRESKTHAEHHGRITLLRHLVQSLEDEHILLDAPSRRDCVSHIMKLVRRDNLQNYFAAMVGKSVEEYIESIENDARVLGGLESNLHPASQLQERGSIGAERRLDLYRTQYNGDMRPNEAFEEEIRTDREIIESDRLRQRREDFERTLKRWEESAKRQPRQRGLFDS